MANPLSVVLKDAPRASISHNRCRTSRAATKPPRIVTISRSRTFECETVVNVPIPWS